MAWQQQLWLRQVENLNAQAQSRVVVLTALALSAADGRYDERLFAALGAAPTLLRRRRSLEAGVLTQVSGSK